jgi:hypothetical protein
MFLRRNQNGIRQYLEKNDHENATQQLVERKRKTTTTNKLHKTCGVLLM